MGKRILFALLFILASVFGVNAAKPTYSAELEQKAKSGDAFAQRDLAVCYYMGNGVTKNLEMAEYWWKSAADKGVIDACRGLFAMYLAKQEFSAALPYAEKLAGHGGADAAYNIGVMYSKGNGVPKDDAKAVEWYTKAAELCNGQYRNWLGVLYFNGNMVRKDEAEAAKWFKRAAAQGYKESMLNLALCYLGRGLQANYLFALGYANLSGLDSNPNVALVGKVIKANANKKNPTALYAMGLGQEQLGEPALAKKFIDKALDTDDPAVYFIHGSILLQKKEYASAASYIITAAEAGDADAQYYLGCMYYDGTGVAKNLQSAAAWLYKSAASGNADAMFLLALMYRDGEGVSKDLAQYANYMKAAAENGTGDNASEYFIGMCYYDGTGVQQDYHEAAKWFKRATNKNISEAFTMLGECYYYGRGVRQNYVTAAEMLNVSVDSRKDPNGRGAGLLSKIYRKGVDGIPQDFAYADELLKIAADTGDNNSIKALEIDGMRSRMYNFGF
jgi:TPR repeat protein